MSRWVDAGKAYGIPIPLLAKYKIGRSLVEGDIVTVKRCYEKYVCNVLSLALLTGLYSAFLVFLLLPVLGHLAELIVYLVKSCLSVCVVCVNFLPRLSFWTLAPSPPPENPPDILPARYFPVNFPSGAS